MKAKSTVEQTHLRTFVAKISLLKSVYTEANLH